MKQENNKFRLHVVDAIRGFAIVSIMLLHNIEHFDFYYTPANLPHWMLGVDRIIWDSLFFLFGGKSYAMFAMLFGLTFFIQTDNQEKKGKDFRARFAWRMLLLLGFGYINSAFYQGDILSLYAVVGLLLIPVQKLSNKVVLLIAMFLFIQPLEIFQLVQAIKNPDIPVHDPVSWSYFGKMGTYIEGGSMLETIKGNLTNGKYAVLLWNWENGRYFHMLSLFMFGMLAGRKKLFAWSPESRKFWTKGLIISAVLFIPLFAIQKNTDNIIESAAIRRSFSTIETSWSNISFMVFLMSGFVLLFHSKLFHKALNIFSPIGKMSLSNYIFQSIIGASIYYGFGLGLYKYTGATYSVLIGILLAILLGIFCTWWAKHFKHGPLETLWHKATWIGTDNGK